MICPRCGVTLADHEAGECLDIWVATTVLGYYAVEPGAHAARDGKLCRIPEGIRATGLRAIYRDLKNLFGAG
jgi:ribosomal protein S27AE